MDPAELLKFIPNAGALGIFVYVLGMCLNWMKESQAENHKMFEDITNRFTAEIRLCRSEFQTQIQDVTNRLIDGLAENATAMSELKVVIHDLDNRVASRRLGDFVAATTTTEKQDNA